MKCDITVGDDHIKIVLSQQLIYSDTAEFASVLTSTKEAKRSSCSVDLSELNHIDSSGLRMLLLLHDVCRGIQSDLRFQRSRGQVRDMLLHSRFDTIVRLED